jgi:hypothetical protein
MRPSHRRQELLTALEAVREAIDIPHAATIGDAEIREQILYVRLLHAVVFLDRILGGHSTVCIPWSVEYLREQLAKYPAQGYKTWDELQAELAQRPAARQARLREHRPGRPAPGSEPWTCRGCGGQVTGRRTPGGLCTRCIRGARS